MIIRESADAYHAREAVSAGFCWDIVKEGGCAAQAWHHSVFNPDWRAVKARREASRRKSGSQHDLDTGSAVHLAVLESHDFAERCSLVSYPNWRTSASRDERDQCIIEGKIPLLPKDYDLVVRLRSAIEFSDAWPYFFGDAGESEVSFTWDFQHGDPRYTGRDQWGNKPLKIACKARADRILPGAMVDLKTAVSASPEAFQRAMVRDGHHLRAAWYLDGWAEGEGLAGSHWTCDAAMDYLYVVVAKTEPHLVSVNRVDERALEWGRMLRRKALSEIRRGRETGVWSGYSRGGEKINTVSLPAFTEHRLADMEEEGEL